MLSYPHRPLHRAEESRGAAHRPSPYHVRRARDARRPRRPPRRGRHRLARRAHHRARSRAQRANGGSPSSSSVRSRRAPSCRSTSGPSRDGRADPVTAYLHAAAMVKAGVYLQPRLAPGYAEPRCGIRSSSPSACSPCSWAAGACCGSTTSSCCSPTTALNQLGFLVHRHPGLTAPATPRCGCDALAQRC